MDRVGVGRVLDRAMQGATAVPASPRRKDPGSNGFRYHQRNLSRFPVLWRPSIHASAWTPAAWLLENTTVTLI